VNETVAGEKKRASAGIPLARFRAYGILTWIQKSTRAVAKGRLLKEDWGARELLATYRVKEASFISTPASKTRMPIFEPRSFCRHGHFFGSRSDSRAKHHTACGRHRRGCALRAFCPIHVSQILHQPRGSRVPGRTRAWAAPGEAGSLPVAVMRWTDSTFCPRSSGASHTANSPTWPRHCRNRTDRQARKPCAADSACGQTPANPRALSQKIASPGNLQPQAPTLLSSETLALYSRTSPARRALLCQREARPPWIGGQS